MDLMQTAQLLGNFGEFVGAVAVVATLGYLAVQIRNSNRQNQRDAIRHTWDSLNATIDRFSESIETASIINRGRANRDSLDEDEWLIFQFIHIRFLNTLESWHLLLDDVSDKSFVEQQVQNIADVVEGVLDYPAVRELWSEQRHTFAPGLRDLVDSKFS